MTRTGRLKLPRAATIAALTVCAALFAGAAPTFLLAQDLLPRARAVGETLLGVDPMRGTFLLVGLLRRGNDRDRARADSLVEAFAAHPTAGREGLVRLGLFFSRGRPERALPVGERLVAEDASEPLGRLVPGFRPAKQALDSLNRRR